MKAKYYDASSKIIEATAQILIGFVMENEAGLFHCEHPNIRTVPAMQEWLLDVAIVLPELWD